jgi:cytochrome P450
MVNISFVSKDIFKEIPHVLESWWKITLNVANQVNTGFFNNLSVSSRAWLDTSLGYMQTLGQKINIYSSWWIVPVILLLSLCLPLYLDHYRTKKRLRNLVSNIPGPSTLPILGNVQTFACCNLVQFFQKLVEVINKYGPIVRFWVGNTLYIVISDAESIETLLTSKSLVKKCPSVSKIINGSGILAYDDEKWKIHRRVISSTFNNNVLDQYMGNFVKNSLILTQKLKSLADGSTFDIYPSVCACTLDIICETTMGINVSTRIEEDGAFLKNLLHDVEELGGTFKKSWTIKDWLHNRKEKYEKDEITMKYLHEFVDKVMTEKLESRRNGFQQNRRKQQVEYVQWVRGKEMCLLELLIQDDQLSVEEIRDEICTLIVAGTKVTSITCCYVLYLLGVYQKVQDKVLLEQEKIFGEDIHRAATGSDLSSMIYLEQVCYILTHHSDANFTVWSKFIKRSFRLSVHVSYPKQFNSFGPNLGGCEEILSGGINFLDHGLL